MTKTQGFYVKDLKGTYHGPRQSLGEARSLARETCPGNKVPIFYGQLIEDDKGNQIDKELYLIRKARKR